MRASTSASPTRGPPRCISSPRWTMCRPCAASSASSRASSPAPPTATGASPAGRPPPCCISGRASATGWPTCTTHAGLARRSSTSWATTRPTTPVTTRPSSRTSRPSHVPSRGGTALRRGPTTWRPTPPTRWRPHWGHPVAWPPWSCRRTRPGRSRPPAPTRPGHGAGRRWCRLTRSRRWPRPSGEASAPRSSSAGAHCGPTACTRRAGSPRRRAPRSSARRSPPTSSAGRASRRWTALAYLAEMAQAQLDGVRHLVLVDAKSPVSFFAYPDKASDLVAAGCIVHTLARPGEDAAAALAALAEAVGAPADAGAPAGVEPT